VEKYQLSFNSPAHQMSKEIVATIDFPKLLSTEPRLSVKLRPPKPLRTRLSAEPRPPKHLSVKPRQSRIPKAPVQQEHQIYSKLESCVANYVSNPTQKVPLEEYYDLLKEAVKNIPLANTNKFLQNLNFLRWILQTQNFFLSVDDEQLVEMAITEHFEHNGDGGCKKHIIDSDTEDIKGRFWFCGEHCDSQRNDGWEEIDFDINKIYFSYENSHIASFQYWHEYFNCVTDKLKNKD
jgi:hypothetical protein